MNIFSGRVDFAGRNEAIRRITAFVGKEPDGVIPSMEGLDVIREEAAKALLEISDRTGIGAGFPGMKPFNFGE